MDQFRLAASGERDGLWDWDLVSNRVHFSPRWVSMVGCEDGEVGNSPEEWLQRVHTEDQPRVRRDIETHLASDTSDFDIQHRMRQRNGTYRWMTCRGVVVRDEKGVAVRLVGSHADVTADHVADPLTGLPNRALFLERLVRSIERARRNADFLYAVLLIDVDQPFAEEPAQEALGDALVTAAARRLEACLRGTEQSPFPGDDYVVARLRGRQFAVLLDRLARVGDAQKAAERVLAQFVAPFRLRGQQVFPRASIGIALSASGHTRTEDVMRDADAALYRARSLGGNRCEVFDIDLVQSVVARLDLEADLEQALERNEFLLFYQPVLEASSNRIAGLEALARWQHPTRGMIPPQEFISVAEQTGFIVSLGNWTLREACRQLKAWQESLPIAKDVWVSVNLSSAQFRQPGIVERVGEALRDAGLDPACLMLELTESVVMEDPAAVRTQLMQLRVMGVRVGIDDFGTGHSSFAYLHQFPADFLKVDQSLIRGMEGRQDKADIVGTLTGLAERLGLRVIAEGIESEAGLGLVRSRRCEYLQGFLLSRPVDADAAANLLKNGVRLPAASGSSREKGARPARSVRRSRIALYASLAVVCVLLSTGLAVRSGRRPATPAAPPMPSLVQQGRTTSVQRGPTAEAPTPPPTAAEAERTGVAEAGTKTTVAAPATPKVRPRAARPSAVELAVEHRHVFGGCQGVLRVSHSGVSFTSDNAKDVLDLDYGRFQSVLGDDTLTIKSDRKTYRFKATKASGSDEDPSPLQRVVTAIDGFRPK